MALINAVVTTAGLAQLPKLIAAVINGDDISSYFFKIGEGGWTDASGSLVPKTPSLALSDLDCVQNPGSYPADSRYSFQKELAYGDLSYENGADYAMLVITCTLAQNEVNANYDAYQIANGLPAGNPEFWELAVFAWDGNEEGGDGQVPIIYATFPKETKTTAAPLTNVVRLKFKRAA